MVKFSNQIWIRFITYHSSYPANRKEMAYLRENNNERTRWDEKKPNTMIVIGDRLTSAARADIAAGLNT